MNQREGIIYRIWLIGLTIVTSLNLFVTLVLLKPSLSTTSPTVTAPSQSTTNHPWPMFHGAANHTGRAAVIGPQTATLKWKTLIGKVQGASPNSVALAADGTVYVAGAHKLVALDASGQEKWSRSYLNAQGPAIADDGTVYVASTSSIVAVSADGKEEWSFPTGGKTLFGPTLGPDGTIYQGSWDRSLYALNPDGTKKWQFKTAGAVSYPPTLAPDGTIYLGGGDAHSGPDRFLYALAPNGQLKWQLDTGALRVGSPAIGSDGLLYVPASPALLVVNPEGQLKWAKRPDQEIKELTGIISPALGPDGTIYSVTSQGIVFAIDATTQAIKWRYQTPADPTRPPGTGIPSFPVVDREGTVYLGSVAGTIFAIDRHGELVWSYQTGGPITEAAPALDPAGTLYFTSEDGYLYAFGR